MTTADLLRQLQAAKVKLALRDGRLSVSAPKGALTEELRASLRDNKAALIELLSETESAGAPARTPIPVADRDADLPLSFAQQRIWFLEELEGGSSVYNIPWAMRVRGKLDPDALHLAIRDLSARHESLRTTFRKTDEEPVQVIAAAVDIPVERLALPGADTNEVREQVERWARTRFDLSTGPLLRVGLIETGRDEWVLVLVIHHIISDGWSLDVLQNELFALYTGHVTGAVPQLPPLKVQLADYASWQRGQAGTSELGRQLTYWREQLRGAPPLLELPTDKPRPAEQSYRGSHVRRQLPGDLSRQLKELAGDHNVTLFMLLLAAFQVLLARYSGQDDIVVGTPVAGRQQTELEGLIGLFLNTLAIRADLSSDPGFTTLLRQIQERSLDAFTNQDVPFDRVVDALGAPRDMSHAPVFQAQFILQNAPAGGQPLQGLEFAPLEFDYGTAKFDLTLAIAETGQGIAAEAEYCTDLFEAATVERLLEHFEVLLQAIVRTPDMNVSRLALLGADERRHLLTELNTTARDYPAEATLQSLLEHQTSATPAAPALVFGDVQLTYAELNARANQLAYWLRAAGVGADTMVGVYMERSIEMVVALLGIIKAGGAYVPMDPDYPEQRLLHMLEDAAAPVILTHAAVAANLPANNALTLELNAAAVELGELPTVNPPPVAGPDNLAYVIFTSGSTGRPKGVMNEHRGIVNRLLWMQDEYGLDATDRVLQKTPFSFDVSVWEFFWPLLTGATLVVAKPGGHRDSDYLVELICGAQITTLHFVPSMLQVFLQNMDARNCVSLRRVICSGEALSHDLQTRFYVTLDAGLHNLYGPTEAAIDVTYWACQRDSRDTSVPIGRPVANTQIYIVEPNGEPAPLGVAGELWIGGVQVARGYASRPDLTAERFIPDPFAAAPAARVYRTGDLARYRNDGAIEFMGRIDHQVKLRGFRIELGDIEASLDGIAEVGQSLVMLREDAPGNKQLVAYVTGAEGGRPDVPALRDALKAGLPEYMVPAAFVILEEFPLLPNGKVDRTALPEPEGTRDVASEYVPPSTPAELTLAQIWSDLLRVERVGIHDNFFELGGDSILSIQIITRAAKLGVHLQPKQVFRFQTIAELAAVAGTAAKVVAEQGPVTGIAPLTPIQHWFFAQPEVDLHHFNQSIRLRAATRLDAAGLQAALNALVVHHDALRLRFTRTNVGWQQEFKAPGTEPQLRAIDTRGLGPEVSASRILDAANELQASLQLDAGCLLGALLCDNGAEQELIVTVHHLAMDGLSWRILLEDLETAYTQVQAGKPVALPPKTTSFREWSERLTDYAAGTACSGERDWWSAQDWPADATVPTDKDGANTVGSTASASFSFDRQLTRQLLQDAPAAYGTQINDLLLAALARAWRRWSGQSQLLVDLEGHGREEVFDGVDVARTVGWFTTLYPVCLDAAADAAPGAAIKHVKERLRTIPNKGFGYGLLRYMVASPLADVASPQIMFNYLGQFDQTFATNALFNLADGPRGFEQSPARTRSHLLDINGGIYDGQLSVAIGYSSNCFAAQNIQALADGYREELAALVRHCGSGRKLGYTPSDFPLAGLQQAMVDQLVADHADLEDIYPVTPMQHGMLFHSLLAEAKADRLSQVYLTQVVWDLEGPLQKEAFEQAWQIVTDRHASLRTSFHQDGPDEPVAIVHSAARIHIEYADWGAASDIEQTRQLNELLDRDREDSFDVRTAPLMRLFLFRLGDNSFKFIWSHHHVIMDGWSIPVVLDELFKAYASITGGTQLDLGPARAYRDYIEWLQAQDKDAAQAFWQSSLAGFDAPTPLPGATRAFRGLQDNTAFAKLYATLSPEDTEALRATARKLRLTVNTLAQGVWALLLSRYTGEEDVLFGATTSGRPAELKNVESMVGLFLNTLPVRARLEPDAPARTWFADLQETQLAARAYEYASLTDIQGWSDVPRGTPLFHTLLIFENYPDVSSLWEDRDSVRVRDMQALGWTSFPLAAAVSVSGQLILRLSYDTGHFEAATVRQMASLYEQTLLKLIAEPDALLRDLLLLDAPPRENAQVAIRPTNEFAEFTADEIEQSIVARFEATVQACPHASAVRTHDAHWSYAELNARANTVAHALLAEGIEPGDRVGLLLGHDAPMLAGLLGTLKAGAAYVPLDPGAPAARLQQILADAQPRALVYAPEYRDFGRALAAEAQQAELPLIAAQQEPDNDLGNPQIGCAQDALAYILFTSGSTGTPKGVMQIQRNVLQHVRAYTNALHLTAADRLTLFSPYGFDAAVMDIYGALLNGACLCPLDIKKAETAADIIEQLPALGITIFHSTPTVYRFLFEQAAGHDLTQIRFVVLGGEEARPGDLQLFRDCCRPGALFVNGLGPTESTLALQYFADHATPVPPTALPVGRPVAGTDVLLLDAQGQPAGLHGEICIRSEFVTPGYWNAPELTAAAFLTDAHGRRIYRTGDLGRFDMDGQLIFIGRRDAQVKVRGHRIEPGEVEVALVRHATVDRCVVVLMDDERGESRLTAYCVLTPGCELAANELRRHLQGLLPDYMIPTAFVAVPEIPLTPNGKLDRNALPTPAWEPSEDYVAPVSAMEIAVANIWADVLGVNRVGLHDDFFELGGHSLIATRLMARIRDELATDVPLSALFDNPTVAGLLPALGGGIRHDRPPLLPRTPEVRIPLSFTQQRLWFLDQLDPGSTVYVISWANRLRGTLDRTALQSAVDALVARHESLRTRFATTGDGPVQIVADELAVPIQHRALPQADAAELAAELSATTRVPFDLATGPLLRVHLLELDAEEHVLSISIHHIIADNWSIKILMRDLVALYESRRMGTEPGLPQLPVQYADYAIWQRSWLRDAELERQVAFWTGRLAGAPLALDLPTDRPRPPVQTFNGAHAGWFLGDDTGARLRQLAAQEGCSLFMVLLAAYAVLLARYSGQRDLLIGTPIAGRQHTELEDLIGFFVNTLVMRADLTDAGDFRSFLRRVRKDALDAFAHQDLPFEKLVEELQPERDMSRSPLFQVAFILQNTPDTAQTGFAGLESEGLLVGHANTKFDMTLGMWETAEGLGGNFEYNSDLFDAATIERLTGHFERLLHGIATDPDSDVFDLPLLDELEIRQQLTDWNATQVPHTGPETLHGLFAAAAAAIPGAVAVECADESLTYLELDRRSNQLAHELRKFGAGPNVPIALCTERSPDMLVGVLGILKSGAAYVPLDPAYPGDRIAYMLEDSGAPLLVTISALNESLPATQARTITLDRLGEPGRQDNAAPANDDTGGADLAYIIYTSGSTGKPKGVQIEHAAAVNFLAAMAREPGLAAGERLLAVTTLCFDISVLELLLPLAQRATVVIATREQAADGQHLCRLLDSGINLLQATPATWRLLLQAGWTGTPGLKVLCGGEALDRDLAMQLHERAASVWNMYGPTEATVWSSCRRFEPAAELITVGRPLANTKYYVLDERQRPVPLGVSGELYIGGAGVARGYRGRPELTAEKFLADPYSRDGQARMYRTGDLARFRPDGDLQILGRTDFQVKLRGFRIELGEIEAALADIDGVDQAVVVLREDVPGDQRLVAYLTGPVTLDSNAVRAQLRQKLPDYMLPAAIVTLAELPLTPNGKINRRALPAPEYEATQAYVAPRTELQALLCALWAEVLNVQRVGISDDFFTLGGHSLLATLLLTRMREQAGVVLTLREFFDRPTIEHIADAGTDAAAAAQPPTITPRDPSAPAPLSFAQQRIWILDELEEDSAAYNIPSAVRLRGALDAAALQTALDALVARHGALRTRFPSPDGTPVQLIANTLQVPVISEDLSTVGTAELDTRLRELAVMPMDLERGPLLRVHLLRAGVDEHVLLLVVHHIVADGLGVGIMLGELAALYNDARGFSSRLLEPLGIDYADYATWQRQHFDTARLAQEIDHWRTTLSAAPSAIGLLTDKTRPPRQTFNGAHVRHELTPALSRHLREFARGEHSTLFMLMLAAFDLLLARYSGDTDIVVGTPVSGRHNSATENIVGVFLNMLPIRVNLAGNPAFRELLARIRAATLDAQAHQDVPFEKLVAELEHERDLSRTPIFQVMFTMQQVGSADFGFADLEARYELFDFDVSKYDLSLFVADAGGTLSVDFEYNTDLFEAATIERMLEHFGRLLQAVVTEPDAPVSQLRMLDEQEEQRILIEWNRTGYDYPVSQTVHSLFERQATANPAAPALWSHAGELTYRDLNRRANKLAAELVASGIGPDVLVAVCTERTAEMITGMLAILKAGGAYVPLDPNYPPQRVAYMLEDSAARILLTQSDLLDRLPEHHAGVICLDTFDWTTDARHDTAPRTEVQAGHLAYTIYTSGSTGQPKGVMIEHRNTVALIEWAGQTFSAAELSGVLASTSICFDLSVYEIFCTLGLGGRIVLAENALELPELPPAAGVTLVNTVPSAIAELVRMQGLPASVRTVNLAGEPLSTRLVNDIYAVGTVQDVNDLYGPSEDTTYSTWTRRQPNAPATIGRPVYNTQAYILDADARPVPVGVPGELYLGGAGVTRGYHGRPELTAERYVPDRFSGQPNARLYRTGDKARYRPNGEIEFLGRIDHQIKLRGFRIELGEIEARLEEIDGMKSAVALVREDRPGDKQLVAYLVPEDGCTLDLDAIRARLGEQLPDFMLPAAMVVLETLPLTPNGKLDRKALPQPEWTDTEAYVAPTNATEAALCEIWADILGRERIGIHDDFFALGGHSLLGTQVIARVRGRFSKPVKLRTLFTQPTIAGFAAELGAPLAGQPEPDASAGELTRVPHADGAPLSFAQQRLWFLDQMEPGNPVYNIPLSVHLRGELDQAALQTALDTVVARHETLRTSFAEDDAEPVQVIHARPALRLEHVDVSGLADADIPGQLAAIAAHPFTLTAAPLLRVTLLEKSPTENYLSVVMHHTISDGWSLNVFFAELLEAYAAAREGRPAQLAELPVQYADYAIWQRDWLAGAELQRQTDFWREQLRGAPALLELPTDRPRPAVQTYNGAQMYTSSSAGTAEALRDLARDSGCTLYMVLLAALNVLLARHAGQDDIVIGTPIAGRKHTEVEALIGYFINTVVLRTDLSGNPSFSELLQRVRTATLDAFEHQEMPFEKLVEELKPARNLSHTPVFQVMFNLHNEPWAAREFQGLEATGVRTERVTSKFDLSVHVDEYGPELRVGFEYNTDLFDAKTIEALMQRFNRLLEEIARNAARTLADLPLGVMPADEPLASAHAPVDTVSALFELQAERTPDQAALRTAAAAWTYRELNAHANRIAAELIAAGQGAGKRTGLLLGHDQWMIAGLLGALKSGGSYVPLDPYAPPQRIRKIADEAGITALVTDSAHADVARASISAALPQVLADGSDDMDVANPAPTASPADTAYILFTSGSTGTPKGVMQTHRNVIRHVTTYARALQLTAADRISLFSTYGFDASIQDIFGALLNGGCVYPFDLRHELTLDDVLDKVRDFGISVLHSTPTVFRHLFGETLTGTGLESVRAIVLGGEETRRADFETYQRLFPDARFINGYGLTESTMVLQHHMTHSSRLTTRTVPVGVPVADTRVTLRDRRGMASAICGEICIESRALTPGYWNDPEQTAARLTADPADTELRTFRTGDQARRLVDGTLIFAGREDDQVKIRGHRIELQEIALTIEALDEVGKCAVLVDTRDPDDSRLLAYVTPAGSAEPSAAGIRSALRELLPPYMLPSSIMILSSMPLTRSGKVDRKALPAFVTERDDEVDYVAPESALQQLVANIWRRLLKIDAPGIHDDFFALGGHSLLTIRLLREIEKQTGQRLTIASVFEGPTIERIATLLEAGGAADQPAAAGVLMPIKTSGSRPPLFAIDGEPTRMAKSVHPEQPLYSLYHAYDPDFDPPATLQELGAHYIRAMKGIQPEGPYHIAGFCLGGLVGYEMTRQLIENGEQVAYLALIDPTIPGRRGESRADWVKRSFAESASPLQTFGFFVMRAFRSIYARTGYTQRLVRSWIYRKLGLELPLRLRHIRNSGKLRASHKGYRYRDIAQAGAVFLVDLDDEDFRLNREFWESVFTRGAEMHKIEGLHHHAEFLTEPYISNVTRAIDAGLSKLNRE